MANAEKWHKKARLSENPPLDTNFFERIRQLRKKSANPPIVVPANLGRYAKDLLGFDPFFQPDGPLRMEDFFKDVSYDVQAGLKSDRDRAIRVYTDMVNVYSAVLRRTTNWLCEDNHFGGPVGALVDAACRTGDPLTIITFNHDLVVENEIMKRKRLVERWCAPDGYGALSDRLEVTGARGVPPKEAIRLHNSDCDHSRPISVLKLHGSLNWRVRLNTRTPPLSVLAGIGSSKKSVLMTPWRYIPGQLVFKKPNVGPGRTTWYTWPVIIPPVHGKQTAINGFLADVWDDARVALASASRIAFVGYSLPPADVEAEKLFQRTITKNTDLELLDVVNPDPHSASRYASIFPRRPLPVVSENFFVHPVRVVTLRG